MIDFDSVGSLVVDLDGTLAASKQEIQADMAQTLAQLAKEFYIVILSGGDWPQFERQVLPPLSRCHGLDATGFFFMPTSGAKLYHSFNRTFTLDEWSNANGDKYFFSSEEKEKVIKAFEKAVEFWEFKPSGQIFGPQVEFRDAQITFSALGQKAPIAEKEKFDPDFSKRKFLKAELDKVLDPKEFCVKMGGSTSIDITKTGIDKEFAIRQLVDCMGWREEKILFIGDSLFEGGNDWPVTKTKCQWHKINSPEETRAFLEENLVRSCE